MSARPGAGGAVAHLDRPLMLDGGARLEAPRVAYTLSGRLTAARDNAVLILHGLTADQYVAAPAPDGRPGWWARVVGPGLAIDTDRWCVLCPNALGGWGGSSAPMTPDPATGRPYGMRFPLVTVGDSVTAQAALLDHLGIARVHAAVGGCFGGFQVYEWMARFPERIGRAVAISATPATSAHNTALWSVLRAAIMADPAWAGGDYYGIGDGAGPQDGLSLMARIGALFWMNRETLETRFGLRRLPEAGDGPARSFAPETEVEAFLERVGRSAAGRLDANGLLYLTRAVDSFDLTRGGPLQAVFAGWRGPTWLVAYRGDWRYPAAAIAPVAEALRANGTPVSFDELDSPMGHGAFLYDPDGIAPVLRRALDDPDAAR